MPTIKLPTAVGHLAEYRLREPKDFPAKAAGPFNRVAYAAAHVVADPLADVDPWLEVAIDWERTIAYREHLWDLGLGVAEAMDTAQRGMGLDWSASLELIRRSLAASKARAWRAARLRRRHRSPDARARSHRRRRDPRLRGADRGDRGAGRADHPDGEPGARRLRALAGRLRQGLRPDPLAAARALHHPLARRDVRPGARKATSATPTTWRRWTSASTSSAANAAKVDGIKLSLLDKDKEIRLRARLPQGVRMYTGDDFNYAELIAGDGERHSATRCSASSTRSRRRPPPRSPPSPKGRTAAFHEILAPTVPLSRHIFKAPTRFYKTGVVLMAYLNGHQDHFTMVGGQESARSTLHLAELFRLADAAGLLRDPELAVARMRQVLAVRGVEG